ncbi:hypothetical protein [Halalkalibacterium ligniniphilum]|uniref:hypothetical protein n=1 Tax=Halalkalibacterium ligniniphilum TaxID=1134413 RepID=UPI00034ADA0C|nr:hypothetical protein [Halalkalibacterium ligniniphilum]
MNRDIHQQQGSSLLTVLLTMAVIAVAATAFLTMILSTARQVAMTNEQQRSYDVAEMGVTYFEALIREQQKKAQEDGRTAFLALRDEGEDDVHILNRAYAQAFLQTLANTPIEYRQEISKMLQQTDGKESTYQIRSIRFTPFVEQENGDPIKATDEMFDFIRIDFTSYGFLGIQEEAIPFIESTDDVPTFEVIAVEAVDSYFIIPLSERPDVLTVFGDGCIPNAERMIYVRGMTPNGTVILRNETDPDFLVEKTVQEKEAYVFQDVPYGVGYYVTQVVEGMESGPSPFINVCPPPILVVEGMDAERDQTTGALKIPSAALEPGATVQVYTSDHVPVAGTVARTDGSITLIENVPIGAGYYVRQTVNGAESRLPSEAEQEAFSTVRPNKLTLASSERTLEILEGLEKAAFYTLYRLNEENQIEKVSDLHNTMIENLAPGQYAVTQTYNGVESVLSDFVDISSQDPCQIITPEKRKMIPAKTDEFFLGGSMPSNWDLSWLWNWRWQGQGRQDRGELTNGQKAALTEALLSYKNELASFYNNEIARAKQEAVDIRSELSSCRNWDDQCQIELIQEKIMSSDGSPIFYAGSLTINSNINRITFGSPDQPVTLVFDDFTINRNNLDLNIYGNLMITNNLVFNNQVAYNDSITPSQSNLLVGNLVVVNGNNSTISLQDTFYAGSYAGHNNSSIEARRFILDGELQLHNNSELKIEEDIVLGQLTVHNNGEISAQSGDFFVAGDLTANNNLFIEAGGTIAVGGNLNVRGNNRIGYTSGGGTTVFNRDALFKCY